MVRDGTTVPEGTRVATYRCVAIRGQDMTPRSLGVSNWWRMTFGSLTGFVSYTPPVVNSIKIMMHLVVVFGNDNQVMLSECGASGARKS